MRLPHDVSGGCTPKPRNDSVDSVTIATAIASVAFTMIGPIEFGRMWRTMIRELDAPLARAASTNSFSLTDSTWPRTTRAMYIQPRNASTAIIATLMSIVTPRNLSPTSHHRNCRIPAHVAERDRGDEQCRHDEEQVGDAHQQLVGPRAEVAATAPTSVPTIVEMNATARPIFSEIWPA